MSDLHIDAGHGAWDNGASSNGFIEKVLTLEATKYQAERFKELGVDVSTTRLDDSGYESKARTDIVKNSGADICISNHYNAGGGEGAETIHSIYSDGYLAQLIVDEIVEVGQPLRRVFSREGRNGDYYYMHRMTGSVQTIIIEYAFLDSSADAKRIKSKVYRKKMYEGVVKALCQYMGVTYKAPNDDDKEAIVTDTEVLETTGYEGVSLKSKVDGLRFYDHPSWEDTDVIGRVPEGSGFPTVVALHKVDSGKQYEVKNSNGRTFYITAADKFVELEKETPDYVGKRVESIHSKGKGRLRFYSSPSWKDADKVGTLKKGYGFPEIVEKVKVGKGEQFKVKNSKGKVFYVTANERFVRVVK